MDISSKLPPIDSDAAAVGVRSASKAIAAWPGGASLQKDRVELSAQGRSFLAARGEIGRLDDDHAQKVARIKAEVEAGTYRVDSHKTASRMIEASLMNDME